MAIVKKRVTLEISEPCYGVLERIAAMKKQSIGQYLTSLASQEVMNTAIIALGKGEVEPSCGEEQRLLNYINQGRVPAEGHATEFRT